LTGSYDSLAQEERQADRKKGEKNQKNNKTERERERKTKTEGCEV